LEIDAAAAETRRIESGRHERDDVEHAADEQQDVRAGRGHDLVALELLELLGELLFEDLLEPGLILFLNGELRLRAGLKVADRIELLVGDRGGADHQFRVARKIEIGLYPGSVYDGFIDTIETVVRDFLVVARSDARLFGRRKAVHSVNERGDHGARCGHSKSPRLAANLHHCSP